MSRKPNFSKIQANGRICTARTSQNKRRCEWYVPVITNCTEKCKHAVLGKLCFATEEGIKKRQRLGQRFYDEFEANTRQSKNKQK